MFSFYYLNNLTYDGSPVECKGQRELPEKLRTVRKSGVFLYIFIICNEAEWRKHGRRRTVGALIHIE